MITKKITKVVVPVSMDKKLAELIKNNIGNKSKYVEWLIYQDLKSNNVPGTENIFI